MTFRERLKIAARAAVGLISEDAATQAFGMIAGINRSQSYTPVRGTRQTLEGYSEMPWLRAVSQKVSQAVAAAEWTLHVPTGGKGRSSRIQRAKGKGRHTMIQKAVDQGDLQPVETHILLDSLAWANPFLVGTGLFRVTQLHIDLVGEAFWVKDRNALGAPVAFWPIPPNWVQHIPSPGRPFYRVSFKGWQGDIPDEEILYFKDPDPANPYARGSGIAQSLADELETDEYAARHCHDEQTECLTRRGWVSGLKLDDSDEIATWNPETENIEYHRPLHITRTLYSGDMHHWTGRVVDACVTPTHRLWVERRGSYNKETGKPYLPYAQPFHFEESQKALSTPGRPFRWRDTGRYNGSVRTVEIPGVARVTKRKPGSRGGGRPPKFGVNDPLSFEVHAFAAFLGYYVSEGNHYGRGLQISQSEGKYVEDIRRSLAIFDKKWVTEKYQPARQDGWSPMYKWSVLHNGLAEWIKGQVGHGAPNKRLPFEVFEWPVTAQLELLRTLLNGDGSRAASGTSASYWTHSSGLADDVQRLCVQVGWSAVKKLYKNGEYGVRIRTASTTRMLYSTAGSKQAGRSWAKVVPYNGIVWCVTVPNELFFSRRNGCVMLGGNTRMTFLNQAMPGLVIWPDDDGKAGVVADQSERMGEQWLAQHQGFWKAALPHFATRKIGIKEFGRSFKDLELTKLRTFERNTIIQTWGVPPEVLGIIESSNRATSEVSDFLFKRNVIVPRLELLRMTMQEKLVVEYDERLILDYVSPVEADKEYALDVSKEATWARTIDEWREMQGLDPIEDDKGKVYLIPTNVVPVSDPSVPPPSAALPTPVVGALAPQRASGVSINDDLRFGRRASSDYREAKEMAWLCRDMGDEESARLLEKQFDADPEDLPELTRRVGRREREMRLWLTGEITALSNDTNLAGIEAALATGNVQRGVDAMPLDAWSESVETGLAEHMQAAYMDGVRVGAEEAGITLTRAEGNEIPFNVPEEQSIEWAERNAATKIVGITEATEQGIRDIIADAIQAGESVDAATRRIEAKLIQDAAGLDPRRARAVQKFADKLAADGITGDALLTRVSKFANAQRRARAILIARTELIEAANAGQQGLWDTAAKRDVLDTSRLRKKWIPTPDELLHIGCEELGNEAPVAVDGVFSNGLRYPPDHPACRCSTGLVKVGKTRKPTAPESDTTTKELRAEIATLTNLVETMANTKRKTVKTVGRNEDGLITTITEVGE